MLGLHMELRHMILRFCDHVDLCHLSLCSKGGVELVKSFCHFKGAGLSPNLLVLDKLDSL